MMSKTVRAHLTPRWMRWGALPLMILTALVAVPTAAGAAPSAIHRSNVIVLPGAKSAEGIAKGRG